MKQIRLILAVLVASTALIACQKEPVLTSDPVGDAKAAAGPDGQGKPNRPIPTGGIND